MASLYTPPNEAIFAPLLQRFPCRERQIRALATLLHPSAAPCPNLVLHGTEATGKSSITAALLASLAASSAQLRHATVDVRKCITARHMYETIVARVAEATASPAGAVGVRRGGRCETVAQLVVELQELLGRARKSDEREGEARRFVLVLDAVDRAREVPATLMPALARLSEIMPSLTMVFILTAPATSVLRTTSSASLHFPPYSKSDLVQIVSLTSPSLTLPSAIVTTSSSSADTEPITISEADMAFLWPRYLASIHDALLRPASHPSPPQLLSVARALWPRFTTPISQGQLTPKEFSKLLIAARSALQDESVLNPGIVSVRRGPDATSSSGTSALTSKPEPAQRGDLPARLPKTAKMLLIAAYLASHNSPKHDLQLFSTHHHGPRKRRRGGINASGRQQQHKRIARKLLTSQSFVLERMLAVFAALRTEWMNSKAAAVGVDADVAMALATLGSLRLLVRVGGAAGGDVLDRGGKWRVNVGWEVVRGLGRSMGVEVEEWLIE